MSFWVLNDAHEPVPTDDVIVWARFLGERRNVVEQTTIGQALVSTVFLGIEHGYGFRPDLRPLLFETMIFVGDDAHPLQNWQERTATWDEAKVIHAEACALVRGGA